MLRRSEWIVSAGIAGISLAAVGDTGVHSLTQTTLTAWGGLALLLLVGAGPPTTRPTGAGRCSDLLLICLLAVGLLSAFRWTVDSGSSQLGLIKLADFVLLALCVPRLLRTPSSYRPLLLWLALLAGGLAVYGFLQWPFGFNRTGVRLHSVFLNPNSLAGLLAATLPLTIALSVSDRSTVVVRGAWLLTIILAASLAATGSRGGWLAAAVGVTMTLFLMEWRRISWRSWLAGIALLGCAVMWINVLHPGLIRPRAASLVHPLTAEPLRYQIWRSTIDMIKARPLTGWGIGAFGVAYVPFKSRVFDGITQYFAHNDYLQLGAELGVPGLVCWSGLISSTVWMVVTIRRRSRQRTATPPPSAAVTKSDELIVLDGVVGGTTAILLHSLVDFDLYVPAILTVLAIYLGYVRSSWQAPCGQSACSRMSSPATRVPATWGRVIRPVTVMAACGLAGWWVGQIWMAELADRAGQQLMPVGRYEEAVGRFAEACAWNPAQAAYQSHLGSAYKAWADYTHRLDLLQLAETHFRSATTLAPSDYRYYWDLGRFYHIYAMFSGRFIHFDPWGAYVRASELYPAKTAIRLELNRISHPSG
jgi:O-antigen ligase